MGQITTTSETCLKTPGDLGLKLFASKSDDWSTEENTNLQALGTKVDSIATTVVASSSTVSLLSSSGINAVNQLTNGSFLIWRESSGANVNGVGSVTTSTAGTWGPVAWKMNATTSSAGNMQKLSSTYGGLSLNPYRTTDDYSLHQVLENFRPLRGKTVTFSIDFSTETATPYTVTVYVTDSAGSDTSAYSVSSSDSWTTLKVSRTIDSSATSVLVRAVVSTNSTGADFYFRRARLVIGTVDGVVPFQPVTYASELRRSRRYYAAYSLSSTPQATWILPASSSGDSWVQPFTCAPLYDSGSESLTAAKASGSISSVSITKEASNKSFYLAFTMGGGTSLSITNIVLYSNPW